LVSVIDDLRQIAAAPRSRAHAGLAGVIMIAGPDDHDPPECMIGSTGLGDHEQTESAITIDRNAHHHSSAN